MRHPDYLIVGATVVVIILAFLYIAITPGWIAGS